MIYIYKLPPLPSTPKTVSERAQPPLPITPKSEPRGPLPPVPPQQPTNKPPEKENLENFPWYYRNKEREEGDAILRAKGRVTDGVFLVRNSQRGGNDNPFTLALLFSGHQRTLSLIAINATLFTVLDNRLQSSTRVSPLAFTMLG
ncbi:hypothetical protein CAPTEDRAFT_210225 [Capitella teleta]|uniref:SH2 domain-containing protein n=1 Tax=Capitella teleta TaxID=283909 RepID=R7UTL1_CAPTE|nr:hypothetical protein CAPTEDRAFT_210225 [Capitella teleta]|eukprot:ELU09854.1 hypothetical protein CAPTEDRAFT_210225 [Capitella teleta]